METYRITILNDISEKKRRINISAISFIKAIEQANWLANRPAERIIKAELLTEND